MKQINPHLNIFGCGVFYLPKLKELVDNEREVCYKYYYDVDGNILFKKEYALCTDVNLGTCLDTKTYTYKSEGWRDRLNSFDGQSST